MPSYVRGRLRGRLMSNEEIAAAYAAGDTAESIAQRACCCGVTVLEIVRAAGIAVRKPGRGASRPRAISDAEIIRRYRDGQTGPVIGDAAGCTAGTVYRVLRDYDVPIRPSISRTAGRKKSRNADG